VECPRRRIWLYVISLCSGVVISTDTFSDPNRAHRSPVDRGLLVSPEITDVRVLRQNWTDEIARHYYNMPQGSRLLRYRWFLNLEQADSNRLFRDEDNIRSLGYLPRSPARDNPDGLPIGFVKDEGYVGMTCAACHTAQINYRNTAWLVDGAPTLGDGEMLLRKLENALKSTLDESAKFDRFARAVLKENDSPASRTKLRNDLRTAIDKRSRYNARNLPGSTEPRFGPARIDAFGGILNEVAVTFAHVPDNKTKADAPVSYPCLWDTPQHDVVQWNGSAPNTVTNDDDGAVGTNQIGALRRNIGEVVGVFADVETTNDPGLTGGYASSVNRGNLIEMEELLRQLWSPLWPKEFGQPDADRVAKGKTLYMANCVVCHKLIIRNDETRQVKAVMADVGTDKTMARNFTRTAKSGVFKGRRLLDSPNEFAPEEPLARLLKHIVERVMIGGHIIDPDSEIPSRYAAHNTAPLKDLESADTSFAYKARPLNGIWATAPYLHNGSVPTLDDLLKPAKERIQRFRLGSLEFDPEKVGFRTEKGEYEFDTTASPGNSNTGHDVAGGAYRMIFTDLEREQLIEYLKTL